MQRPRAEADVDREMLVEPSIELSRTSPAPPETTW
jgi:hypothetical protein